ncbi:hypothetical protein [Streptomyces sp. NPDC014734]|uniref:hypothetical protein n=1 Tax=Streptomyces sp. NPDC014734 TaxID=3364886 RepID=UPI0036FBA9E8
MEIQHETRMEPAASSPQAGPETSGSLLVARSRVKAARARMFVPSDNTAGKSDGND